MRKLFILIFILIFSIPHCSEAPAFSFKKDYQKKFLRDANNAEKRKNDKSAFHLYEKLIYYYPTEESYKSYAEFCARRKFYSKAIELYQKLYDLTKNSNYLSLKYLYQVRSAKLTLPQLKKILQDKTLATSQKKLLTNELINQFSDKQAWDDTRDFCSKLKTQEINKDALINCITASEKISDNKATLRYYLRYHEIDKTNVNIIKKVLELAEKNNDKKIQEAFLQKFANSNPKDKGIKYRLAGFYVKTGSYYKATKVYQGLIASGDKSEYVKTSYAYALSLLNSKWKVVNPSLHNSKGANKLPYHTQPIKLSPPSKEDNLYAALREKNFAKAQPIADEILRINPKNPKIIRVRSDIALEQKDYKNAIIYLEKLNNYGGKKELLSDRDKKILAFSYSQVKDYNSALKIIERLLVKSPNNTEFSDSAIEYTMALKDNDKALFYVNKALAVNPTSEKLLKTQGDLYSSNKDFIQAINSYIQLIKRSPKKEYYISLIGFFRAINDNNSALALIEPIYYSTQNDPEVTDLYLNILLSLDKIQEAYNVAKANNLLQTKEGYRIQGDIAKLNKNYKVAQSNYINVLQLDPENQPIKLKLAESYRGQKKYSEAERIYSHLLTQNADDVDAKMGLGYIDLDKKEYKSSRKIFENILIKNPDKKEAKMAVAYTYMGNGDNIKTIDVLNKIPEDEAVNIAKAKTYYEMGMYSNAQETLRGSVSDDSDDLRYKINRERALIINPSYSIFIQQLAENFKLDYNKVGLASSKYIGNNLNAYGEYNMYVYSSGKFESLDNEYNNFTNELRGGVQGRPTEKFAFKSDLGVKVFQDAGAMLNTDSWVKHYFNDDFNLKLGFMRNNLEQSYLSAVGLPIDNVFTGQVPDNKVYLEFAARHPRQFYSFGRVGYGVMGGQNLPNNPYQEGMLGVGRTLYDNPENKYVKYVAADVVSYNAGYKYDLLKIYDNAGNLYGGYWSPAFFTADNLNLKIENETEKIKYGVKGFAGWQIAFNPNQSNLIWGAGAYLAYNINELVTFKAEYSYFNYADVQRNLAIFSLIIRGFKGGKK